MCFSLVVFFFFQKTNSDPLKYSGLFRQRLRILRQRPQHLFKSQQMLVRAFLSQRWPILRTVPQAIMLNRQAFGILQRASLRLLKSVVPKLSGFSFGEGAEGGWFLVKSGQASAELNLHEPHICPPCHLHKWSCTHSLSRHFRSPVPNRPWPGVWGAPVLSACLFVLCGKLQ